MVQNKMAYSSCGVRAVGSKRARLRTRNVYGFMLVGRERALVGHREVDAAAGGGAAPAGFTVVLDATTGYNTEEKIHGGEAT